jgi:hypothetical protein
MAEHICNRDHCNQLHNIKTLSAKPQYVDQIIRHVTELKLHTNMNSEEEKPLIHSLKELTKPLHKDTKHHYGPQNFLTIMHSSNNNNIMVPPGSPLPYLLYLILPSQSLQIVIS